MGVKKRVYKIVYFCILIYIFLCSIQLMGLALKLFGKGFAEQLIQTTSNPFVGLIIGIVATSIIQSSSTTTCLVVGLVSGGALTLGNAIPIVMGANIGTTITNTLVSMAHITRKQEFQRAFAAGTVHDFFNVLAVIVLFPLELRFHFIEKSASFLSSAFVGIGGIKIASPIKLITQPAIQFIESGFQHPILLLLLALFLLFFSLIYIVRVMRLVVVPRVESFFDEYLFRNDMTSFTFALILTSIVQSSSITTSLVVPLVGAGILTVRKIFPYTIGANMGTTVTAMLAAFATLNPVAITVAFSHLMFNIFGTAIFYPLKKIPITIATNFAKLTTRSRKNTITFLVVYYLLYIIPLTILLWK